LEAGGVSTRVLEAGGGGPAPPGDGRRPKAGASNVPDVLLLHGIPTNADLWRHVMAALAPTHHVIAPDLPGLGYADRPRGFDYSFIGLGRWLGAFVDTIGLKAFHLGIHDLGGPVGMVFVRDRIAQVRSLLVYNTVMLAGFRPVKIVRRTLRPKVLGELLLSWPLLPLFVRIMARLGNARRPLDAAEFRARYVRPIEEHPDGKRVALKMFRAMDGEHLRGCIETVRDSRIPVRIIWARKDPFLTPRGGERIHAALPGSELHWIENASHFLQDDAPEEVARLSVEFLRGVESGPR
jgi:pimeloyl-ACP methyl ester carboxylesterase